MTKDISPQQDFIDHTRPFYGGSGNVGVLLCHGFTGSPWSMRPWADHLVEAGYRVSLPLLPGHGTTWQDLNATKWPAWYKTVESEYLALKKECDQVFVAGLSMGGGLAIRLAEHHDVAGLLLVNPAVAHTDPRFLVLPFMRKFVPSLASIGNDIAKPNVTEYSYDRNPLEAMYQMSRMWVDIRSYLDLVIAPVLLFRSINDHTVPAKSSQIIINQVSSTQITERLLHRSFHVATLDYEAQTIFEESVEFIKSHSR